MSKSEFEKFSIFTALLFLISGVIYSSPSWGFGIDALATTFNANQRVDSENQNLLMARHRGGRPHGLMHSHGFRGAGVCPQSRSTPDAPDMFLKMKNPLQSIRPNILAGKELFHFETQPTACKICHGVDGNGLGIMAEGVVPMPRNFTCKETMSKISDGQLFYVITYGSQGTTMPAFRNLSDEQVWQLIIYIRTLAK